jgi:hypothetical protein
MKTKSNRKMVLAVALLLATLLSAWYVLRSGPAYQEERWDVEAQEQTAEVGRVIIDAIASFKHDNGSYLEQLSSLSPHYLESFPEPMIGSGKWVYNVSEYGYTLYVKSANDEPPPLVWMLIFGKGGYDDRSFTYYSSRDAWGIADL